MSYGGEEALERKQSVERMEMWLAGLLRYGALARVRMSCHGLGFSLVFRKRFLLSENAFGLIAVGVVMIILLPVIRWSAS